ncbi:Glucokinase [Leclercia adecarboxylata]|uniref:Glucokinase n=1 Tax=Leclercia adecarboxylata TaxID=83655 RepID=A0A4U9I7U6_9ENTR|nr:Glucokinase [Leclercia adecarboxylata]
MGLEDKGRFRDYVQDIPVYLIVHDNPGLLGAGSASASDSGPGCFNPSTPVKCRSPGFLLQVHQLAKLFHLAATHRHLKIQILQPQNIGVG